MAQFIQLTLLSQYPSSGKKHRLTSRRSHPATPRTKKSKLAAHYLAFDDDYFWELIRKDYASAWRYVDRMTRF